MSRLRIFSLFAALAALATVLAACGGGSGSSDEARRRSSTNATLEGIESGDLDLSLGVDVEGDEGGDVDVSLSGPFQSEGEGRAAGARPDARRRTARSAAKTSTSKAA